MKRELLTIDVNVARDYIETSRRGHRDAVELFRLARVGVIELATTPQGYLFDVDGPLLQRLREVFQAEGIPETIQLSCPSEFTYPGPMLFPGAFSEDLTRAWGEVLRTWRSHEGRPPQPSDQVHLETHLVAARDVFLTSDQPLLAMCRRLRSEHGIQIRATTPAHYLAERRDVAARSAANGTLPRGDV